MGVKVPVVISRPSRWGAGKVHLAGTATSALGETYSACGRASGQPEKRPEKNVTCKLCREVISSSDMSL